MNGTDGHNGGQNVAITADSTTDQSAELCYGAWGSGLNVEPTSLLSDWDLGLEGEVPIEEEGELMEIGQELLRDCVDIPDNPLEQIVAGMDSETGILPVACNNRESNNPLMPQLSVAYQPDPMETLETFLVDNDKGIGSKQSLANRKMVDSLRLSTVCEKVIDTNETAVGQTDPTPPTPAVIIDERMVEPIVLIEKLNITTPNKEKPVKEPVVSNVEEPNEEQTIRDPRLRKRAEAAGKNSETTTDGDIEMVKVIRRKKSTVDISKIVKQMDILRPPKPKRPEQPKQPEIWTIHDNPIVRFNRQNNQSNRRSGYTAVLVRPKPVKSTTDPALRHHTNQPLERPKVKSVTKHANMERNMVTGPQPRPDSTSHSRGGTTYDIIPPPLVVNKNLEVMIPDSTGKLTTIRLDTLQQAILLQTAMSKNIGDQVVPGSALSSPPVIQAFVPRKPKPVRSVSARIRRGLNRRQKYAEKRGIKRQETRAAIGAQMAHRESLELAKKATEIAVRSKDMTNAKKKDLNAEQKLHYRHNLAPERPQQREKQQKADQLAQSHYNHKNRREQIRQGKPAPEYIKLSKDQLNKHKYEIFRNKNYNNKKHK